MMLISVFYELCRCDHLWVDQQTLIFCHVDFSIYFWQNQYFFSKNVQTTKEIYANLCRLAYVKNFIFCCVFKRLLPKISYSGPQFHELIRILDVIDPHILNNFLNFTLHLESFALFQIKRKMAIEDFTTG